MLAVSVGGIVALAIVVAVVLVLVFAMVPRLRRAQAERRLEGRRREVAGRHREDAQAREAHAELAEREARRARAEAEIHEQEARLHEQGLADDGLTDGRGRFAREGDVPPAVERDPERETR